MKQVQNINWMNHKLKLWSLKIGGAHVQKKQNKYLQVLNRTALFNVQLPHIGSKAEE